VKKALLGLLLALLAHEAFANACVFNVTFGAWTTAGNWTSCGGVEPTAADTCSIPAGRTAVLDAAADACGAVTVSGTLIPDPAGTTDADGFHVLTLTAPGAGNTLTVASTGVVRLRSNAKLRFDTTAGPAVISLANGGVFDGQGETWDTTITAITASASDGTPCVGSVGRQWDITVKDGASLLTTKRRVLFKSGRALNRHYEIITASGSDLTICSDYADGSSAGQRLTPHAAGVGTGPAVKHSDPTLTGTSDTKLDPAVGDTITIVKDGWIDRSAGTNGWYFSGPVTGLDPIPVIRAMHLDGIGHTGVAAANFTVRAANQTLAPFEYNNVHDYAFQDGITYSGARNLIVRWNAFHDGLAGAGEANEPIYLTTARLSAGHLADITADNNTVENNVFYRIRGNAIQFSDLATFDSTGNIFRRNIVYEGCTTTAGECNGIEVNACSNCRIEENQIYRVCRGNNGSGDGIHVGGSVPAVTAYSTSITNNWIVNVCGNGIGADPSLGNALGAGVVGNYISHTFGDGIVGGITKGNVVKNVGLAGAGTGTCWRDPVVLEGNFCIGNETSTATGGDCDGVGDSGCSAHGVTLTSGNAAQGTSKTVTIRDNGFAAPDATPTTRRGVRVTSATTGVGPNYNILLEHWSTDGRGATTRGVNLDDVTHNPAGTVTWTLRDFTTTHTNDSSSVTCTTVGNVTDVIGASYANDGLTAAEDSNASSPVNCSSATAPTSVKGLGHVGRLTPDWNYQVGMPALTAGTSPAGSPIGIRAFRFNRDRLTRIFGSSTFDGEWPANVANVGNADSYGDGIIDLHDNCDRNPNPSQADTDADGAGDACDP
jgi:hypothetical protein